MWALKCQESIYIEYSFEIGWFNDPTVVQILFIIVIYF